MTNNNKLSNLALRYQRLFETAQDGILLLDYPDGRIQDVNPYLTQLIGYTHDELVNKQLWEIGLLSDKEKAQAVHRTILEKGYVRYEDIDLVTKKGNQISVEFVCNSYHVNSSLVIQCNIRDITARKKAQIALAQEQKKVFKQMNEMIDSLSNVIEARDPYTAGHQSRVSKIAEAISHELQLPSSTIDGIRFAANIHDIGKIGIPAEILTKPSTLTALELALLHNHSQAGYDIVKPLSFPWPIGKVILQHHERLNGSGYPNALKGDNICIEAKIVAVADTIEAMSSYRPYRPAKSIDSALLEIKKNSGILYDEIVVEATLSLFQDKNYQLPLRNNST